MNRTIVALDFSSKNQVVEFLDKFDKPIFVKVGMELVYAEGLDILKLIKDRGHNIFLDLKLHDIPNTVKNAMKNLAKLGVDIVNLHAAGGIKMMEAAIAGLEEGKLSDKRPLCIAVTQLTSTSQEMMNEELLISGKLEETVVEYAKNAKKAGLDGVVCSVHEARLIHEKVDSNFITVTPGIRLEEDSHDDQKRVATPKFAKEVGCDYIVVGRSITKSENPTETYFEIEEIMGDR